MKWIKTKNKRTAIWTTNAASLSSCCDEGKASEALHILSWLCVPTQLGEYIYTVYIICLFNVPAILFFSPLIYRQELYRELCQRHREREKWWENLIEIHRSAVPRCPPVTRSFGSRWRECRLAIRRRNDNKSRRQSAICFLSTSLTRESFWATIITDMCQLPTDVEYFFIGLSLLWPIAVEVSPCPITHPPCTAADSVRSTRPDLGYIRLQTFS